MTTTYSAYPAPFSDHKAVGILWSTKVDYATWFGANVEYIHCIQMIPFLPISEELLREEWIQVNMLKDRRQKVDSSVFICKNQRDQQLSFNDEII